jgi:hypothetical protein
MPLERDKILVDNLLACLNLYQTSLVWALTAAVVFYLLTLRLRAPSQSTIPPLSTASNPTTAWLIALALCLVLGSLALTALHRAEAIFMKLSLSRELLQAILLYPSLATNQSLVARVGSVLLCPLAVVAGIVMAIRHEFTGRLLLDSRVVALPRSSNLMVVTLSSLKPLFFNGLKKALPFSDNIRA